MSTDEQSIRHLIREELKAELDARENRHAASKQFFVKELVKHVMMPAVALLKRTFGITE